MYLVTAALRISHGPWMLSRKICAWNYFDTRSSALFLYILLIFHRISYICFILLSEQNLVFPLICVHHISSRQRSIEMLERQICCESELIDLIWRQRCQDMLRLKFVKEALGKNTGQGKLNRQFLWNYKYILRGSSFFIQRNAVLS